MKKLIAFLLGILAIPSASMAASPQVVPSVATLRASNFKSYPTVTLQSWYAGLNKGGGTLVLDTSDTTTADNSCTIYVDAGGNRFKRQVNGALDVTMCGVKADGATNDAAAFNLAYVAAATLPAQTLTAPGGTIKVNSTVTAAHGVTLRGAGMGTPADSIVAPTIIDGSAMTTGWVFDINTPNGVVLFEAPKYYDMEIIASQSLSNPPGGCIRWNNIANGFTDNASSQYYMLHPHAERIYCLMNSGASAAQIGIQCNKCFDGDISQSLVFFGLNGIDIEGSDMVSVGGAGANRVQGAIGPLIKTELQGTFGNKIRIVGNHLLSPGDFGQSYSGFIEDGAISSVIDANHMEGIIAGGVSVVWIDNGYNHVITNNDINGVTNGGNTPIPCWLKVQADVANLVATANGSSAASLQGPVCYSTAAGGAKYFYNGSGLRQIITHSANGANGDIGWPFNSVASSTDSIPLGLNIQQYYSPNADGLNSGGVGVGVLTNGGYFQLDLTGSSNYIDFGNTDRPKSKGVLQLYVLAARTLGAANINCSITDNGVVAGYNAVTLTTTPKWFAVGSTVTVSTGAGARCYPDQTGTKLYAVMLGQ